MSVVSIRGPEQAHAGPVSGQDSTVLIADDDDLVRASFGRALDRAGYRVLTAKNGSEALEILERRPVGILVLDIFMPERDGLETLLIVRRLSPGTRVVVMSGKADKFDYLDAALKLGADNVVRKPAMPSDLLSVLNGLVPAADPRRAADRRRAPRLETNLEGQIFNPVDWESTPCTVLNLSEGGALIACTGHALPEIALVLYVAHFGRFEAVIAHRSEHLVGLRFKTGEAKLNRLKDALQAYAEHGVAGIASRRKYPRVKADGKVSMLCESGEEALCDVLDISPDGVSLRTHTRPTVGVIVRVGKNLGRVVRHHEDGVALQFIR